MALFLCDRSDGQRRPIESIVYESVQCTHWNMCSWSSCDWIPGWKKARSDYPGPRTGLAGPSSYRWPWWPWNCRRRRCDAARRNGVPSTTWSGCMRSGRWWTGTRSTTVPRLRSGLGPAVASDGSGYSRRSATGIPASTTSSLGPGRIPAGNLRANIE